MKFPMERKHSKETSRITGKKESKERLPAGMVMLSIFWCMDGLYIAIINSQHYSSLLQNKVKLRYSTNILNFKKKRIMPLLPVLN
jgi:hypothetical protein